MTKTKTILVALAGALTLLAVMIGSMRWDLPETWVRERLQAALIRDTGYRITSFGGATFTALPWPVLQISRLEIANGSARAETATVPLAKARLNVFSWLAGEPRLSALTLFEPSLNLHGADRLEETEAVATLIASYLRQGRRPSLTYLRVQSGEVTLDGGRWVNGLTLTVSNVASRDLRLDAAGAYRAQAFRLQVEVAPATRTAARPIAWAFDLGDLAATFRGVLVAPPSLDAEGQISVALGAGALRSRPLSLSREVAALFDGLSIRGEGRLSLPQIQLRSVVFERGETRLRGGIDAVLSTTAPRFSGTLHAESLTIDPASAARSLTGIYGRAPEVDVLPRWLRAAQADVRLSADRVLIGGVRVLDAAATTKIGGGRLDVSMSEARLGGGTTKGRAAVSEVGDRLEARITLQMTDIDLAAAFGMGLHPLAAGIASGQLSVDLSGRSPGEMFDGASGRGQVAVRNGELAGLDVERFLRRAEVVGEAPPDGRSAFRSLDVTWQMSSGIASLTGAHIRSPLWAGRVEGDIDLKQRKLDLLARFSLERTTGPGEERALHMNGPLQAPVLKAMPHPPGRS